MAVNDAFIVEQQGVADGNSLTVEGGDAGTGAAEVWELGGSGDADIYREIDTNGDSTYDISFKIDTATGTWHSQGNQLVVSAGNNTRIRVENTSGGSADFYAVGMEVDD